MTRARKRSNATKSPDSKIKRPSHRAPLKFIDDISSLAEGADEEELTQEDEHIATKSIKARSLLGTQKVLSNDEKEGGSSGGRNMQSTRKNMQLLDKIHGLEATGAYKRLQEHQKSNSEDELPSYYTKNKTSRRKKGRSVKKLHLDSDITFLENEPSSEDAKETTDSGASPVFHTQQIPEHSRRETRKKRLFPTSSSNSSSPLRERTNKMVNRTMEEMPNVSDAYSPRNIDTPELEQVLDRLRTPLSARRLKNTDGCMDNSFLCKSSRLREILAGHTPLNKSFSSARILAHDTPESEHGMTVRQRQLRNTRKTSR